jgi:hypothetical protein
MGILAVIVIIGLLVWGLNRISRSKSDAELSRRNNQWIDYIAAYQAFAKTPKEKAIVERMLNDAARQYLGRQSFAITDKNSSVVASASADISALQQAVAKSTIPYPAKNKAEVQLDNASLLLYFGAFLFVAAAGLFVAFGSAGGLIRTLIVLLVSIIMYGSGVWIHANRPKLKQAAQAFAGIGIVLAPLVGSALYVYVLHHTYGAAVWALTSLFCALMYAHALRVFHSVLMGYVLIFTLLSLFESGIGLAHVPLYYYGWGLATAGIILHLLQRINGWMPELHDAADKSAILFMPVSVFVAFAMIPTQGTAQLGVSLLIASAYYTLEVLRTNGGERKIDAVVAQLAAVFGVTAITYGITHNAKDAELTLLAADALQLVAVSLTKATGELWRNYGSVLLVLVSLGVVAAVPYMSIILPTVLLAAATGLVVWLLQRRADAYAVFALGLAAVPYVAGQLAFVTRLAVESQTWLGLAAVSVLLIAYILQVNHEKTTADWRLAAIGTYLMAVTSVLVCSLFASALTTYVTAMLLATETLLLIRADRSKRWADISGAILLVPLLHAAVEGEHGLFLLATVTTLAALIVLSLRFRREGLRWLSTGTWLLLPVAMASDSIGGHWGATVYAWAYILAMFGLIFSRAVARGVVYLSSNVPMASYTQSASLSYVAGYIFAGVTAVTISLASPQSRLQTSLILMLLMPVTLLLAKKVEKRADVLAFLPVLVQALLLSAIRPASGLNESYLFAGASSVTAFISYLAFRKIQVNNLRKDDLCQVLHVSVAMAFVSPLSFTFGGQVNWLMALGLLIAALLLQYHIRDNKRSDRELAGGLIVLGLWWMLHLANVHELQAYTHVVVALLGLYAYLRARYGDRKASDLYLWWMIGVATMPLVLEVFNSGGIYGWWLLLEEITIILIGVAIQRSFVIRWGIYVAVAAVLYQLRTYGYGALALLALFLIGLAVYQLQKYGDKK